MMFMPLRCVLGGFYRQVFGQNHLKIGFLADKTDSNTDCTDLEARGCRQHSAAAAKGLGGNCQPLQRQSPGWLAPSLSMLLPVRLGLVPARKFKPKMHPKAVLHLISKSKKPTEKFESSRKERKSAKYKRGRSRHILNFIVNEQRSLLCYSC